MDVEARIELITRNLQEIITLDELRKKIETGETLRGYLGYEPSGLFHIGWMIWAYKVRDLVEAGVDFRLLEATWHAWINDKLGGDLQAIKDAAKYLRYSLEALGLPVDKITFVDAEELVSDKDYWGMVLKVAKNTSLARAKRALTIMGRKADEAELDSSKIIYPFMQVTDIFYMKINLALGGMDQRKAHMLARDIAEKLDIEKPIAIHTPLLTSLQGIGRAGGGGAKDDEVLADVKMSKSKPETTILIHDSPEDIKRKIRRAYCPKQEITFNPILEINKYILFSKKDFSLIIERPEKYGGTITIDDYTQLESLFKEGKIHPADLKNATAEALIKHLEPVREYFRRNNEARKIAEKIAAYQGITIQF